MQNKLIILRGPSGSGKSTIAHALQEQSHTETLIIDQDYYRHILLGNKPDEKNIVPELVAYNALVALRADYNVIIEGIFRKEKYLKMFERLMQDSAGPSYVYYLDVSFDETAKRHTTRAKSALFSAAEMREWYSLAEPLGVKDEITIPEHMSEADTIRLIRSQTRL